MSIGLSGTSPFIKGYDAYRTQRSETYNTKETDFSGNMNIAGSTQTQNGTFVLHCYDNDEGDRTVSASCGAGYSVSVYEPKGFDPSNPVYKVKVWDKDGNMTERMVDISKVDPQNCDYIDMYAYTAYLESQNGCKDAVHSFIGARLSAEGTDFGYDDLLKNKNWIKAVHEMMQMQYDAGNIQGYMNYKSLMDAIEEDRRQRSESSNKTEDKNADKADKSEDDSYSEVIEKPDGSKVLMTTVHIGDTEVVSSMEIAKPMRDNGKGITGRL